VTSPADRWTPTALDGLVVENGFRLRGLETTRLDTFIDAAFAFVLTMLVISFDAIPDTLEEMIAAVKRIPSFAVSFALIMLFWINHREWSRRYGLEETPTVLTSLALIFVVMVWVYPLRGVFDGMFAALTGNALPATFEIRSFEDLRVLFLFYSTGFAAMTVLMWVLFHAALRARERLGLDAHEVNETRVSRALWSTAAVIAVASLAIALTVPASLVPLAGWIYWLMPVAIPAVIVRGRRRARTAETD
jgi:uncharacterized membrane protein